MPDLLMLEMCYDHTQAFKPGLYPLKAYYDQYAAGFHATSSRIADVL